MSTSSEHLSRLVAKLAYHLPDTLPKIGDSLQVVSASGDNVELGFVGGALPDPIVNLTVDANTHVMTIHLQSGATHDIDLTSVNSDTKLTAVNDVGANTPNVNFTLSDGKIITWKPTGDNDSTKKADKTTKVVSTNTALTVTDPTFKDDVTLGLKVNGNSGLLQLTATSEIPASIVTAMVGQQGFLSLPKTPFDASHNTPPTGHDGNLVMVGNAGTFPVVPFGQTAATPTKVVAGDILRMQGGIWHIISRSQTDHLSATKITTAAVGTPSLGGNLQDVITNINARFVPVTRKLISDDIDELTINGLKQDNMNADVTVAAVTNRPNALLKLNALGVVDPSLMSASSFEFHGIHDATAAIAATRPDGVTPWISGDQLEINVASTGNAAFQFVPSGSNALASAPLALGDLLTYDGTRWVQSANGGAIASGTVATAAGTTGLVHIAGTNLNSVMQAIENNAVWITTDQAVAGNKHFTGNTQADVFKFGTVGADSTMPADRGSNGEVLLTNGAGQLHWGSVAASKVSFTPFTGITSTNVQAAIREVHDSALQLTPNANQTLQGDSAGFHTLFDANVGVIVLNGNTLANQVARGRFDAGTFA